MRPAFSVVFLTTLSGSGQGLFLALYLVDLLSAGGALAPAPTLFFVSGCAISLALVGLGLVASFFHLGHPLRAWRALAMWRTSWLSRECLFLPLFMALVAAYGAAHWIGMQSNAYVLLGALGTLTCIGLFVSTGMIYTCIKFLQEWASPWTTTNFIVLGCASGFTLAAALAAWHAIALEHFFAFAALLLTIAGWASRTASLLRNARLIPKSTLQSATGLKQKRIVQKSRGFTGDSFNTREFFHGQTPDTMARLKWAFIVLCFPVPLALLAAALGARDAAPAILASAAAVQFAGLLIERWFFFAQANHPQNLYYSGAS